MRITIFVTLFSISAFAQIGLNGQISTQRGFTRTQLEREVSPPNATAPSIPNGAQVYIVNSAGSGSCLKTACRLGGTFACDDQAEVASMNRVCRGQVSDECLVTTCSALGEFGCDEAREVAEVLVSSCGADENLRPSAQRVQDSGDRQTLIGF